MSDRTLLQRAVDFMNERKQAALGQRPEDMVSVDVETHLALVASTWDVDAAEVNDLGHSVALMFLTAGLEMGMDPRALMRSSWIDGFCIGLAHAHLANQEDSDG